MRYKKTLLFVALSLGFFGLFFPFSLSSAQQNPDGIVKQGTATTNSTATITDPKLDKFELQPGQGPSQALKARYGSEWISYISFIVNANNQPIHPNQVKNLNVFYLPTEVEPDRQKGLAFLRACGWQPRAFTRPSNRQPRRPQLASPKLLSHQARNINSDAYIKEVEKERDELSARVNGLLTKNQALEERVRALENKPLQTTPNTTNKDEVTIRSEKMLAEQQREQDRLLYVTIALPLIFLVGLCGVFAGKLYTQWKFKREDDRRLAEAQAKLNRGAPTSVAPATSPVAPAPQTQTQAEVAVSPTLPGMEAVPAPPIIIPKPAPAGEAVEAAMQPAVTGELNPATMPNGKPTTNGLHPTNVPTLEIPDPVGASSVIDFPTSLQQPTSDVEKLKLHCQRLKGYYDRRRKTPSTIITTTEGESLRFVNGTIDKLERHNQNRLALDLLAHIMLEVPEIFGSRARAADEAAKNRVTTTKAATYRHMAQVVKDLCSKHGGWEALRNTMSQASVSPDTEADYHEILKRVSISEVAQLVYDVIPANSEIMNQLHQTGT